jgi:hypothetical protein
VSAEETQPPAPWWAAAVLVSVFGVAAFAVVILGAAARWLWGRLRPAGEDVHPGLVPVRIPPGDFRSSDERREV